MSVEYITYKKENYAAVVRFNYINEPVDFFTADNNEFQMGMFTRKNGYEVKPHRHVCKPFTVQSVQEFISVKSGKLKMEFFTDEGKKYDEVILNTGDSVLTMRGGHGITFLEESSILEIKQGPYEENKKVYFQ